MKLDALVDEEFGRGCESDKSFIVKRGKLTFNDSECQLLNFTDITMYRRLKKEEETNRFLKTLNASVHHEMIGPLKVNVELCERLISKLPNTQEKYLI